MGDAGGLRVSPELRVGRDGPAAGGHPGTLPPEADTRGWLMSALAHRGISRRRFLGFASAMTALLALPQR